jgi:hypothetical protein
MVEPGVCLRVIDTEALDPCNLGGLSYLAIRGRIQKVIEESNEGEKYIKPPGMLLFSKRLITYIYPLLLGMIFAWVTLITDRQKNTDQ